MIFFEHSQIKENIIKFEALENDEAYGSCILDLTGKNAVVSNVDFASDKPYLAEGLLKAAFNFSVGRNFYMGVCTSENIASLLNRLGFKEDSKGYILDIPSILMGSCCKNQEK